MKANPSPTEKEIQNQYRAAIIAALIAAFDGIAMVLNYTPYMVLCEIALASLAVFQWNLYYIIKTKAEIISALSMVEKYESSDDVSDSS